MKKYKPEWFKSPFGHIKYTLVRSRKQALKLGYEIDEHSHHAIVCFYDESDGSSSAIVHMPKHKDIETLIKHGLIIHEAVHIWQEVKKLMGESVASSEFEAYSIQRISQDLLYLLGVSDGR